MGKFLSILIGLILLALGVWGFIAWTAQVWVFVQAALVLMAIVVGLGIFVFGLSELRAGDEEPPVVEAAPSGDQTPSQPGGDA
ncbi:MAG: hypothetical protein JXA57_07580 [Armatimonadetes bacterium]|nr:hypothetical protein [Armatimonadota bacterium]